MMQGVIFRILERQIRKHFQNSVPATKEWNNFINAVSETYGHFDEDRALIERSLELSSTELGDKNKDLMNGQANLIEAQKIAKIGKLKTREKFFLKGFGN